MPLPITLSDLEETALVVLYMLKSLLVIISPWYPRPAKRRSVDIMKAFDKGQDITESALDTFWFALAKISC